MVLELDTSGQGYKTTFTLHSTNVWNKVWFHCKSWKCRGSSNECIMWAVNSADFRRGGWQLQTSFSQSFLLQFWKSQCPSSSKYPEFSKTPPTFAFWMILKVIMAVFPLNTIFFETPCSRNKIIRPGILNRSWEPLYCQLRLRTATEWWHWAPRTVKVSMTAELLADLINFTMNIISQGQCQRRKMGMQIVGGKPSVPFAVHFKCGYVCMYRSQ